MTQKPATSPLMALLQRVEVEARADEEKALHIYDEDERGALRGISENGTSPPPLPPATSSEADKGLLVEHLEAINTGISTQISELQTWLQSRPLLVQVLDDAMHKELKKIEDRTNRNALMMNIAFTILGAIFGLVLPPLLALIAHLLRF